MCGINGFNFQDQERIVRMNKALAHRGPDDTGVAIRGSWSLGANRLAIIDLSRAGHQPMSTEDGRYTIVMNGEIYNFQTVREDLVRSGEKFFSKSDTEVVLKAYRTWGGQCLEHFNGMFAFAIHDQNTDELFIARDRLGIKPLYYYHQGNTFIFSSEIKSILEHSVKRIISKTALNLYFRVLYVPAPLTIWEDVYKLEPGHWMRVKDGEITSQQYWCIPETSLITDHAYIQSEIRRLLEDSVRLQMVSDRPVGVFLSGGIDSTIVTGIMSKLSPHVRTFSVGFSDTPDANKYNNDTRIARQTATHFSTEHHEYTFTAKDIEDVLPTVAYHMDEPISNHVQAVNFLLARAVRKKAIVVLGGDGGDELFGGYERYYYNRIIDFIRHIPGMRTLHPMFATARGVERYLAFFAQKEDVVGSFLKPQWNDPSATSIHFKTRFLSSAHREFTRQFMRIDIRTWLPDESLMRSDKMSMAASIEQRVPFLDHRLVEFADRIPVQYKLGGKGMKLFSVGQGYKGKVVLKKAMKEYLPQFVLDQPKYGWFSPAAKWLRSDLRLFAEEVLSPFYCKDSADIIDFTTVRQIFDDHLSGAQYGLTPLWAVLTFQLWYRAFKETI